MNEKTLEDLSKEMGGGFDFLVGNHITYASDGTAKGQLTIEPHHLNSYGFVHGGCIFTLIDFVGGAAAYTRSPVIPTISSNINYLSPAKDCKILKAEATEIKKGKRILVYNILVTDEKETAIAQATISYYRLEEKKA